MEKLINFLSCYLLPVTCHLSLFSCLKLFAWFEADSFSGRNIRDFSRAGIAAYAAFARLDYEHAEASQFNALAALQSCFHSVEQRLDCDLGFDFRNACFVGDLIYYI